MACHAPTLGLILLGALRVLTPKRISVLFASSVFSVIQTTASIPLL